MNVGEQADLYIDGYKLNRADGFKYLGSYVTKDCKLDEEKSSRTCIQATSSATGRLRDKVFDCHRDLTTDHQT